MGMVMAFAVLTFLPATASASSSSYLVLKGEPHEPISQGQERSFSSVAGDRFFWDLSGGKVSLSVGSSEPWTVILAPPDGERLEPGRYLRTLVATIRPPTVPALAVEGNFRRCEGNGHFEVFTADYDADGKLVRFDAAFEYICESKALRGRLSFGMSTAPDPIPAWEPVPGRLTLQSDPGEPFLNGTNRTYTRPTDSFSVRSKTWQVSATIVGAPGDNWNIDLSGPQAQLLHPRDYDAPEWTVQPANSGLQIRHGSASPCKQDEASFEVLEIVWGPNDNYHHTLLRFRATFAQRCGSGWLRGELTFGVPNPVLSSVRVEDPKYPPAYLKLTSPAGDFTGDGQTYAFAVNELDYFDWSVQNNIVNVNMKGANGDSWLLSFAAPQGQRVEIGRYLRAVKFPSQPPEGVGLEVKTRWRTCETEAAGHFDVAEAVYGPDGKLQRFDATFDYLCGGGPLKGAIRLGIDEVPATPRLNALPTGNVSITRYAEGSPPRTFIFSSANADLISAGIPGNGESMAIAVVPPNDPPWAFFAQTSPGEKLVPGDYPEAVDLWHLGPGHAGMFVLPFGDNLLCLQGSGSFRIVEATYGPDDNVAERLQSLRVLFTYSPQCSGSGITRGEFVFGIPQPRPQYATASTFGWNGFGELGNGQVGGVSDARSVAGLDGVDQVAAGFVHNLALKQDGTVWAWGYNAFGQLGDGTTQDRASPVQVKGLTDVKYVAAGVFHSLAVREDGTVWAWGWNVLGQLGDGSTDTRLTPVQVHGLSNASRVSAGYLHSLAVQDGSAFAWGWNALGQLGDGTTTDRRTPVTAWGMTSALDVSAGWYHSLALMNQRVYGWGWNAFGQLGDGTTVDRHIGNEALNLQGAVGISAGLAHSLALDSGGTAYAWGWNALGQLGDGTRTDQPAPVRVAMPDRQFRSISAGFLHSMAGTGTEAWAWGSNVLSQIGDGSAEDRLSPVQVAGMLGVFGVAAGGYHNVLTGFARSP